MYFYKVVYPLKMYFYKVVYPVVPLEANNLYIGCSSCWMICSAIVRSFFNVFGDTIQPI